MAREQESGQEIFWQHHRSTPAPPPH
jgi:hypothetical protein